MEFAGNMATVVIRDCKVIRDAQTHQSKGYAFVCFIRQEVLPIRIVFRSYGDV